MDSDVLTHQIIGAAMRVHSILGPGLLESVYRRALEHELRKRGLRVISEKRIPVHYDGVELGIGLRLDLLVEDSVIVETKSVRKLRDVDESQILSHLQLCHCKKGLLINFHVRHLRQGIRRFVR
jgi:GxxExxY protein